MFAPHEHTHRCVHGELHERRAAPVLMTPQAYGDDPWHGRILQLLPDTLRGGSAAAAVEQQYPEYEPPSAVRKPLRIHFDVSRLEDDPGFSCFSWGGEFEDETGKKTQCGWNDVITESKRRLLTEVPPRRATGRGRGVEMTGGTQRQPARPSPRRPMPHRRPTSLTPAPPAASRCTPNGTV